MNETRLDALLAEWAEESRLSPGRVAAIRAIPQPEHLPKDWWKAQFGIARAVLGRKALGFKALGR